MDSTSTSDFPKAVETLLNGRKAEYIRLIDTVKPCTRVRMSDNRYVYLTEHDLHVRVMGDRMLGSSTSVFLCRAGENVYCLNMNRDGVTYCILPADMKAEGFVAEKRRNNQPLETYLEEGVLYTWKLDSSELVEA
jgi:hypothetical protein